MNNSKMAIIDNHALIQYNPRFLTNYDPTQQIINSGLVQNNLELTNSNRKIKIDDKITRISKSGNINTERIKKSISNSYKIINLPKIDYNTINSTLTKDLISQKNRNILVNIKDYYNKVLDVILDNNIHNEYNKILEHIIRTNNFDINTREFIDASFNIKVPAPKLPVIHATSIEDITKNMKYLEEYRLNNVKLMMRISSSIDDIDELLKIYETDRQIYLNYFSKDSGQDIMYIDNAELKVIKLGNEIFSDLRIIYLYIRILNMYQEFNKKLEELKKVS